MADPWNAAWEEAEASAPPGILVYATLELQHAAFVESSVPFAIRAVAGSTEDMNFTLEVGATLNGGETVQFDAIPFKAERPEYVEGRTPESRVSIDNVARETIPYLELAVRTRSNLIAIYREYRSDDLTEPCYGPVAFQIKQVHVIKRRIEGMARIDDLANRKFPNKVYTVREFPGLLP